jgi:hypothetical protein
MGGKSQQAAKGPDNNKRLAEYEREDSRILRYLGENGVTEIGDMSPAGALITRCKSLAEGHAANLVVAAETNDAHVAALSSLTAAMVGAGIDVPDGADPIPVAVAHFEAAEEAAGNATPGEIAAIARADKADARVAELAAEVEDLKAAAAGGSFVRDEDQLPAAGPREPVECGPAYGDLSAADINLRIVEGADLELVFSDGDNEIVEFPPVKLSGADLGRHGQRYTVTPTISISGPRGEHEASIEIAGAALLANGEQIGFSPFDRPLVIEPGEQRAFNQSFLFG